MGNYHLGINLGHDRSVAIAKDGEIIVAIEQERLDRMKHSVGFMLQSLDQINQIQIPGESIAYCLNHIDLTLGDIASITANMPGVDISPSVLKSKFSKDIASKVKQIPSHHLSHAYSAFWPSKFEKSLILIADASGTTYTDKHGRHTESYSLYFGEGKDIRELHSERVKSHLAGLSTLGFIYEEVSRRAGFVTTLNSGLSFPEAGKLMGLAAYGSHQDNWSQWIQKSKDLYHTELSAYDIFLELSAIENKYDTGEGKPYFRPWLVDLAYKVQSELENILCEIVAEAAKVTGCKNLCMAGGVALNSVANYKILRRCELDDIFIFPASSDNGIAAGCALWGNREFEPESANRKPLASAFLGRSYSTNEIETAIAKYEDKIVVDHCEFDLMTTKVSEALAKGNIVARYEGGAEFGPRALGHRSILADPTYKRMKDVVNARVKFREAFRPFAPVVPLNSANKVFHLSKPSPYMLLVAPVRDEYKEKLPAITHEDGTGRIQTCTPDKNPFLHAICEKAEEIRGCAPVLMNTSFNVAGQPIVETPEEAIDTFLETDIDYLALEGFWIRKSKSPVKDYSEHVAGLKVEPRPEGLPSKQADLKDRMEDLDAAIFQSKVSQFWSKDEVRALSQKYARYKETSIKFQASSLVAPVKTQFGPDTTLILDPLGTSYLVDETGANKNRELDERELQVFLALQCSPKNVFDSLRLVLKASPSELEKLIDEMIKVSESFNVDIEEGWSGYGSGKSSPLKLEGERTFDVFRDGNIDCIPELLSIRRTFLKHGYTEDRICKLLAIDSLQSIEPTHLAYYDKYVLAEDPLHDLIRLFQLRCTIPEQRLENIFSSDSLRVLRELKVLIYQGSSVFGGVDIFCSDGFLFATDHRYFILDGDSLEEDPVMYIGMDSHGLVQTAPRQNCESLLDLCCGSGIQGIVATRYSRHVTAVDLNPRAVRFARFNASFNGVSNYNVRLGNLYEVTAEEKFDCILANPPFVPSPDKSLKFRDGGEKGEEVLAAICKGANNHLKPGGRLCVVTDLVDVSHYEKKFTSWIGDVNAYGLTLTTADRDEILFSVPHSRIPFGQTLENYNSELSKWIDNFRNADISAVNFGYLLVWKTNNISGFELTKRTIHNPSKPIWIDVETWIEQRELWNGSLSEELYIQPHPDLTIIEEKTPSDEPVKSELSIRNNSFYTSYEVKHDVVAFMRRISDGLRLEELVEFKMGEPFLERLHRLGLVQLTLRPRHRDHSSSEDSDKSFFEISERITKTTPTCLSSYLA